MNEKIEKLKQLVKIEDYARYMGFHVIKRGKYYTLEEHDSVVINPMTNYFFRNSTSEPYSSGSVINFAIHFGHMDYNSAVNDLIAFIGENSLNNSSFCKPVIPCSNSPKQNYNKMLILPERAHDRKRVYAYLTKTRHIEKAVIDYFFIMNYLYQDTNNNCVFVSYKEEKPNFACVRGTNSYINFKGDVSGCDYTYCFCANKGVDKNANQLVVAESIIDLMSLMTIKYLKEQLISMKCYYQAIAGTQKWIAIFNLLDEHPDIIHVYLCLDNDKSGRECIETVQSYAKKNGYKQLFHSCLPPVEGMDWNDYLKKKG